MGKVVEKVVDGERFSLVVEIDSFCEHCGDLALYEVAFDDNGCTWCLDCADYSDNFLDNFTEEDIKRAKKMSLVKRIAYYEQRLYEWKKYLEKMEASDGQHKNE